LVQICPAGVDAEEDKTKTGEVLGQNGAVVLFEAEIPDHSCHLKDALSCQLLGAIPSSGSKQLIVSVLKLSLSFLFESSNSGGTVAMFFLHHRGNGNQFFRRRF
jgi:hypothetical protein